MSQSGTFTLPKWFDKNHYAMTKLASLRANDFTTTAARMEAAFAASGFIGDEGLLRHFLAYGHKEDLSPNLLFDAEQYYIAKTSQVYGKKIVNHGEVQSIKNAIHNAGMSAWTHYERYGAVEGIDPSNNFNSEKYLSAKLAHVRQVEGPNYTMDNLKAAIASGGMTPLTHFLLYGQGEGFIQDQTQLAVNTPISVTNDPPPVVTPEQPVIPQPPVTNPTAPPPPAALPTVEISGAQHYGILQANFPSGTGEGQIILNSVSNRKGLHVSNVKDLTLYLRGANVIMEDDTPHDDAIYGANLSNVNIVGDFGASLNVEGIRAATVNASGLNGTLRIELSERNATRLIGSQGNDFIETNGRADVITGGDGNDVFRIGEDIEGRFSSGALSRVPTITDFSKGDTIDFSEASRHFQGLASQGQVAVGNQNDLVSTIRNHLSSHEMSVLVVHYSGDTYLAANGDGRNSDDDMVVRLLGIYDQSTLSMTGSEMSTLL